MRAWADVYDPTLSHFQLQVVLAGGGAADLVNLRARAEEKGLPTHLVEDAGLTQVAAGAQTVLAIAGPVDIVDSVTGRLRAY